MKVHTSVPFISVVQAWPTVIHCLLTTISRSNIWIIKRIIEIIDRNTRIFIVKLFNIKWKKTLQQSHGINFRAISINFPPHGLGLDSNLTLQLQIQWKNMSMSEFLIVITKQKASIFSHQTCQNCLFNKNSDWKNSLYLSSACKTDGGLNSSPAGEHIYFSHWKKIEQTIRCLSLFLQVLRRKAKQREQEKRLCSISIDVSRK